MARVIMRAESLKVSAKISARQLAVLVDLSPTVLGNAFAGVTYLGAEKETELAKVTLLLESLEAAAKPLRLPEKIDDLRRMVDFIQEHEISPEQIRTALNTVFGVAE
jgi:hypothetical protein